MSRRRTAWQLDLRARNWFAPSLLGFELANLCLTKIRRYPEQRAVLVTSFRLRVRLGIEERATDHDGTLASASATGADRL